MYQTTNEAIQLVSHFTELQIEIYLVYLPTVHAIYWTLSSHVVNLYSIRLFLLDAFQQVFIYLFP